MEDKKVHLFFLIWGKSSEICKILVSASFALSRPGMAPGKIVHTILNSLHQNFKKLFWNPQTKLTQNSTKHFKKITKQVVTTKADHLFMSVLLRCYIKVYILKIFTRCWPKLGSSHGDPYWDISRLIYVWITPSWPK